MAQSLLAFVSQNGSSSCNNFLGNNYKPKGKDKMLYCQNSQGYQFNGTQSQHAQGFQPHQSHTQQFFHSSGQQQNLP